jgi:hypothetical protein
LSNVSSFFIGMVGSFVVYMLMFRETRIQVVFDDPANNWKTAVFDFVVFLICGSFVTVFLVEPTTPKQAFIGGCSWQGLVGGLVAGQELRHATRRRRRTK